MTADPARSWRLGELAKALDLDFAGDADLALSGVAPPGEAGPGDLTAIYDGRAVQDARRSRAGAVIVGPAHAARLEGRNLVLAAAPKAAFARAIALICPEPPFEPGVHPTAVVAEDVELGPGVSVGAGAVIGRGSRLGRGVRVGPGSVIGRDVRIGEATTLDARVVIYAETEIGPRCSLLAGAVVGAPGFGQAREEDGRVVRVPHLGRVVLEEEVEIGANATIDRATFGVTRIGARTKIDNLVQIGHNADVGADVLIAAQSGLSGSSSLGDGVVVGGQSGVADHRHVGARAAIAAKTAVFRDVPAGEAVAGIPAVPIRAWRRIVAAQAKLPRIWRYWRSREADEREENA